VITTFCPAHIQAVAVVGVGDLWIHSDTQAIHGRVVLLAVCE